MLKSSLNFNHKKFNFNLRILEGLNRIFSRISVDPTQVYAYDVNVELKAEFARFEPDYYFNWHVQTNTDHPQSNVIKIDK